MRLVNEFAVPRPVADAWPVLTDVERLATAIPGAVLTGRDGDVYRGEVAVKVGPVSLAFDGTAEVVELDPAARTMAVRGTGRERRGQGEVTALITMTLAPDGPDRTAVTVHTDLDLGGKVAQFGAGMVEKVSGRIITQFVARLDRQFTGEPATPEAAPAAVTTAAAGVPGDGWWPLAIAAAGAFLFGLAFGRAVRPPRPSAP